MRRLCGALLCTACALAPLADARADADLGDAGVQAAWLSARQARVDAVVNLGLADAWAWHTEVGVRLNQTGKWRPEVATGVTALYDVFAWVPAATVAVGVAVPDSAPSVLALARLELRRYVTPQAWATVFGHAEWTRAGWAAGAGVGFSWAFALRGER